MTDCCCCAIDDEASLFFFHSLEMNSVASMELEQVAGWRRAKQLGADADWLAMERRFAETSAFRTGDSLAW